MALTPEEEKELAELEAAEAKKNRIPGEQYLQARSQMAPGATTPDEQRTRAIETSQNFEDQYLKEQQPEAPLELDGYLPTIPQVLSTLPSQTGPVATPEGPSQGPVYVYEPPLREVQKRLLNDPQFAATIGVTDPQRIAQLNKTSSEYQAAADLLWAEAANAATGAGKTAYRYSQTPWLQDGQSTVDSLKLKATGAIQPVSEGATAFVLGVDDTALFGGVRGAASAVNPQMQTGNQLLGIDSAGGVPAGGAADRLSGIIEENPVPYVAGQLGGAFSPEGLSNKLFTSVAKGVGGLIKGAGAARAAARTVVGGVGAGVAGAADQTIHEGVDAASNLARTGETGTTLEEAGNRILGVGKVAGVLGTGIGALGTGADATYGNYVRRGTRFKGKPGEFERAGGRFEIGRGPVVPPETRAIQDEAWRREFQSVDVGARKLAPKLEGAEKANREQARIAVEQRNAPFYASEEGQIKLPPTKLFQREFEMLVENTGDVNGRLRPIENKGAQVEFARERFNTTLQDFSLTPVEGAVEMTPAQAEAFLSTGNKKDLIRKVTPPKSGPASGGARELDEVELTFNIDPGGFREEAEGAADLEKTLRRRGITKVYAVPRRYNAAEHDQAIRSYQRLDDPHDPNARERKELYETAMEDRQARPMNGVQGAWSEWQKANSELLEAANRDADLVAPGGDSFKPLVSYAKPKRGEMPLVEAVRRSAERAGVAEELRRYRGLSYVDDLQQQLSRGTFPGAGRLPATSTSSMYDNATLRLLYPASQILAQPAVRAGAGGVLSGVGRDDREKKEREGSDAQK